MAKVGSLTVEIKTKLTISDDTADTLLGLLEMYCQEKGYVITTDIRTTEEGEKEPMLSFDPFITEEPAGTGETPGSEGE